MKSPMRYVNYKCEKCDRKDSDKLYENESTMARINCYYCKPTNGKNDTMVFQKEVVPEVIQ